MTLQLVNDFVLVKNEAKEEKKVIELHNDTLEVEIGQFLRYKGRRSKNTLRAYKGDINTIARQMFGVPDYTYIRKGFLESMSVRDVVNYYEACHQEIKTCGEPLFENATINRSMSAFKGLLEYLSIQDIIFYDINKLKLSLKTYPNTSVKIDVLSDSDTDKILNHFKTQNMGDVLYLLGKLAVESALRLNELLTLQWNQFTPLPLDKTVLINSRGKTKGKGHKDWEDEISAEMYEELLTLKQEDSDYVFNISRAKVTKAMTIAIADLKLDIKSTGKKYSFHSFRKNSITYTYYLTGDIMAAKEKANHTNVNTTQRYIKTKKYGVTGRYSLENKVNNNAYKEVSHEILLKAIENMDNNIKFLLNKELSSCVEGDNINTAVV